MDTTIAPALYLIPCTLGDTPIEKVLPAYNHDIVVAIRHFIVEDVRTARRFLKKVDRDINIDELTFYELNKHTSPEAIASYLKPLQAGEAMGVISEAACRAHILDNKVADGHYDVMIVCREHLLDGGVAQGAGDEV